jgi:IS5 family transposase
VDRKSRKIICTTTITRGRVHDRKLLALSKVRLQKETKASVDSGYQGLQKEHPNTAMPTKNTKLHPLTPAQKKANRAHSQERIPVENVIRSVKRFRILAERYRNRRRRFGLRLNLLAAIYNFELGLGLNHA